MRARTRVGTAAVAMVGLAALATPGTAAVGTAGDAATGTSAVAAPVAASGWTDKFRTYGNNNASISDWTASDGAYSLKLSDGRTAWFMGDTYGGKIVDGSRVKQLGWSRNSIVVMDSANRITGTKRNLQGTETWGTMLPWVMYGNATDSDPNDGKNWYWFGDAFQRGEKVVTFLHQVKKTSVAPGFAGAGTRITLLDRATLRPGARISLPVYDAAGTSWGTAVLRQGTTVYIYGMKDGHIRVAKAPAARVEDASTWTYWAGAGQGWQAKSYFVDGRQPAYLTSATGERLVLMNEFQPYTRDGRLHLIGNYYGGAKDYVASTTSPVGPFTLAVEHPRPAVKTCLDVYNYKVHPQVTSNGRVLASYNVGPNGGAGCDLNTYVNDYRPRFEWLTVG